MSKTPKTNKTKYLQIRVTEEQHQKISAYAKSKDKKISEIIVEYLDKVTNSI